MRFLLSPFIIVKQVPPAVAPPSPAQLAVSVGRSFAWAISGSSIPANSDLQGGAQGLYASSSLSPLPMEAMQHARTNQGRVVKTYMEEVVVLPNKRNGTNRGGAGGNKRKGTKRGGPGDGRKKVGAVLFPWWKLHKSKKGSCQLLKAGIGKNLCICVDKKGFRHMEWGKSHKTKVWKPRINSSKAHVKTGFGCDLGPMDIFSPCQQRLVFSGQHSPNHCDPDPLAHFFQSSSQDTFFSWAFLICFPTTQVSMGLNPFGQSCVSRVASFLRGRSFRGQFTVGGDTII